jgi:hypothetical protein
MKLSFLLSLLLPLAAQTLTLPPPLIRLLQFPTPEPPPLAAAPTAGIFLFAMSAITGQSESWVLETHNSFQSLEDFDAAQPRTPKPDARTLFALHRQNWSYRPDEAVLALRKARYFQVSYYRTGLGSESEFFEILNARRASLDYLNIDRPYLVYQVIAGAPSGTYIVFSPLPSLKTFDEVPRRVNNPRPPARAATDVTHENILFRLDPARSHVSLEFAESDPVFWRAK